MELIALLRRSNLSDSPAKSLVAKGLARIEWCRPCTGGPNRRCERYERGRSS